MAVIKKIAERLESLDKLQEQNEVDIREAVSHGRRQLKEIRSKMRKLKSKVRQGDGKAIERYSALVMLRESTQRGLDYGKALLTQIREEKRESKRA